MNARLRHPPKMPINMYLIHKNQFVKLQEAIDMRMFSNPNYNGIQFCRAKSRNEIWIRGIHKQIPETTLCFIKYNPARKVDDVAAEFCIKWHNNDTEHTINSMKKHLERC